MPRANVPAPQPEPADAALAIPNDIRDDLLRAQAEQIDSAPRLPRVKIMPAGANLFEFTDTNETVREFVGVVLNSHPRNVLWDRPYGERDPGADDEASHPACTAPDGRNGTPRTGFQHAALGQVATGAELIACATCPYNAWGSAQLVGQPGRGKGCTNQRSVFVLVEGRAVPVELPLPPTSLRSYDEYLTNLIGRQVPVQSVVTRFYLERRESASGLRWSVARFESSRTLDGDEFEAVIEARSRFRGSIFPPAIEAPMADAATAQVIDPAADEDVPF